ncbi:MAG: dicarboxylate/amino acid:cation symporter [Muribaculaceae bacterium]|nr:dicarboxylate/amino acid:cation symporter [Muribaculaceae bacterium]
MKNLKIPFKKPNLLILIIFAILIGIGCGTFFSVGFTRCFLTFNSIFSNFLGFCVPLIVLGFVSAAIADLEANAGKMLLLAVILSYGLTLGAGMLSFFTSNSIFPTFLDSDLGTQLLEESQELSPYFTINMPPLMEIMTAMVFAFILGLGVARIKTGGSKLKNIIIEFRNIVEWVIAKVIIPLLPLYIFGIFLKMTVTGEMKTIMSGFYKIILLIFVLHILWLVFIYLVAALFSRKEKNPFKLLWMMLPAYFTALGTSSSAATIPVTLRQTIKMGVNEDVAGFAIPLCATIDLSGSALKIVACAVALIVMKGMPYDFGMFAYFIAMMGVVLIAAPGVPGGSIMASLALLTSILGFSEYDCGLMIALYIAMDSFGTACNVTGDGAIAIVIDRFCKRNDSRPTVYVQ